MRILPFCKYYRSSETEQSLNPRASPDHIGSGAASKLLICRTTFSENRFTLFRKRFKKIFPLITLFFFSAQDHPERINVSTGAGKSILPAFSAYYLQTGA